MNRFFRKNKAIIVWGIVFAFLVGGSLLGFGVYFSNAGAKSYATPANGLAKVGNEIVSVDEFNRVLQSYYEQLKTATPTQMLAYQYQVLNSIIDTKLLMQEAKKQKIKVEVTQADLDEYLANLKSSNQITDEDFDKFIKDQNTTVEEWVKQFEPEIKDRKTLDTLIEKVTGEVTVTDEEVKNSYEQVRVSNILISKAEKAEEAKAKAEEALATVKGGKDFAQAAIMFSQDANAENGADMGFLSRTSDNADIKKLAEAAFATEVGQVTDIIETTDAYHILKVTEKKLAEGQDFEAQKEQVKADLVKNKETEVQSQWFEKLKAKSNVKIHLPQFIGYGALIKQDYTAAIKNFEQANTDFPGDQAVLAYLALAYSENGEKDKAISTLSKAIEAAPTNYELYMSLGQIYQDSGETEKAVEQFQKASQNAGDEYMVHFQIQQNFVQLGRMDLAQEEQKLINTIYEKVQKQYAEDQKTAEGTNK